MQEEHIGEYLYEFVTRRMSEESRRFWSAHISQCPGCQTEVDELSKVLGLLDQVEAPNPSEAFKNELGRKLRAAPLPERPLIERIREWFQIPSFKWSLRGAAVAAVLIVSLIAIRDFPRGPQDLDKTPRGVSPMGEVQSAPNPIVIETRSVDESLQRLKAIMQAHQGSVVRRKPVTEGLEVTLKVSSQAEEDFVRALGQLGPVDRAEQGFKDGEGNLVVLLRKK